MKRILVAEDEDAIREFVVINLQRAGYDKICETEWKPCFFEKAKNAPKRHVAMLSFKKGAYHDI